MNLSFDRGDRKEAVAENFRRIGEALGVRCEDMVLSRQTHTTNVRIVTDADRGKGITRERDYTDVDGLVTNVPGICLVTSYADCVPLFFCRSGEKGDRSEPFRMERNRGQDRQKNSGTHARAFRIRSGGYTGCCRSVGVHGLLMK